MTTEKQSIKESGKLMLLAMKRHVVNALAPVVEELQNLRVRLESLPVPVDGKDGKDGKDGADGVDGNSVDLDDIDQTIKQKVLESKVGVYEKLYAALSGNLPVPKDGKDGADGKDGIHGEKGESGKDGADGIDGLEGVAGKDAADIEVLAEINEAKVYAKGTFACHKGGMIHATRKTSPITEGLEAAGWKVCMNGIADEVEEVIGKAMLKRTTVYTSGAAVVTEIKNGAVSYRGGLKDGKPIDLEAMFESRAAAWEAEFKQRSQLAIDRMPKPRDGHDGVDGEPGGSIEDFDIAVKDRTLAVGMKIGKEVVTREVKLDMPIDRGVFQSGKKYDKGDIVTFSGSSFIAQCDTADKPEESKSWRCFVKRGRDGKDGKDAPVPEAIES